jgi:hypothetical protein
MNVDDFLESFPNLPGNAETLRTLSRRELRDDYLSD